MLQSLVSECSQLGINFFQMGIFFLQQHSFFLFFSLYQFMFSVDLTCLVNKACVDEASSGFTRITDWFGRLQVWIIAWRARITVLFVCADDDSVAQCVGMTSCYWHIIYRYMYHSWPARYGLIYGGCANGSQCWISSRPCLSGLHFFLHDFLPLWLWSTQVVCFGK